jgi:hypothetical protein
MTRVQCPAGVEDFSCSLCIRTGSGAHPASYPMGTGAKVQPECGNVPSPKRHQQNDCVFVYAGKEQLHFVCQFQWRSDLVGLFILRSVLFGCSQRSN